MAYLKDIENLEDLKSKYRKLAFKNHPDMGGSEEIMKEINAEYDILFPIWKHKYNTTSAEKNTETAEETRSEFYTQNGWKGENYNGFMSTKKITALIREYIKQTYPLYKFSVTFSSFSGGSSISISLLEAPHEVLNIPNDKTHIQINHYYIDRNDELTEQTKELLTDINNFIKSYRFSDCDGMIDYFDVNFWYDIEIGKGYSKPFKMVKKTLRIKNRTEEENIREENQNKPEQLKNNNKYEVLEDVDTRDNSKIFIVKILESLKREEYLQVSEFMKSIGGYYSKFKHGFLFKSDPSRKITI